MAVAPSREVSHVAVDGFAPLTAARSGCALVIDNWRRASRTRDGIGAEGVGASPGANWRMVTEISSAARAG